MAASFDELMEAYRALQDDVDVEVVALRKKILKELDRFLFEGDTR